MRIYILSTMALVACSGTASVYIPSGDDTCTVDAASEAGNGLGVVPSPVNVHLVDAGVAEAAPTCEWLCTSAGVMNTCDLIVRDCAQTIEMCNPVPAVCQGIPVCSMATPGSLLKMVCDPDASTNFTWTDDAGCSTMPCSTCIPGSTCTMYVPSIGLNLTGTCEPS